MAYSSVNNLIYASKSPTAGSVISTDIIYSPISASNTSLSFSYGNQTIGNITKFLFYSGSVYCCGSTSGSANNGLGFLAVGKLVANSSSLSEMFLKTSYGFVVSELSGTVEEKFNLANVSEFPHSSGLYQMKNMLLGTTTSRKIWNKRRFTN